MTKIKTIEGGQKDAHLRRANVWKKNIYFIDWTRHNVCFEYKGNLIVFNAGEAGDINNYRLKDNIVCKNNNAVKPNTFQ